MSSFQDRSLVCADCRSEFVFSAGEQAFFERRGLREPPRRCSNCRDALKEARVNRAAHRAASSEAPSFAASCTSCGAAAKIPFKPVAGRPIYCHDCYGARQAHRSELGGARPWRVRNV